MATHRKLDSLVHHALINGMIEEGRSLTRAELADALAVGIAEIERSMKRLADNHGLVLHPHECMPWMIHPFAVSPSNTWVQRGNKGWWAPCMWCALGVATLVGGKVTIHARIGGEAEPTSIGIDEGYPEIDGLFAHFALPPKHVWDNVHHYCAMLLPFRSEKQIDLWSKRHGLPRGKAVPITQASALARKWYGRHAESDYRKWTPQEAQEIFAEVGLTGRFWELDTNADHF